MERSEIINRLTTIFRKVLSNDVLVLNDEMTANSVDRWDSLTHMILISEIERAFSIKFKLKDLSMMRNVGSMIEIISNKI